MENYDFGIIGGGPAGYTAAMFLAKQGYSVVLFEKDKMGGTCLNKGCIPTKTFLHCSDIYANLVKLSDIGISAENVSFDFTKIIDKKNKIIEKIRKAIEISVKNSGVKIIFSEALVKDQSIIANNVVYNVEKIILATGSKPKQIKGFNFDDEFILSSDDILNIEKLPKSVLIVGSGAIGIEWARILSNFGVEISMVERAEHLIPLADIEVSKRIERIFRQKKIDFYLNDSIKSIENKRVILESGIEKNPDFVLIAIGREPIIQEYKADKILGDACGEIQLAHYAIHQAKEFALGIPCNKNLIPSIIYGEPEIAWVGLREQDCTEECKKLLLPITALGKSWCDDSIDGFIKIIIKEDKIVGAHIVSKEASSLIHILLTAIQQELPLEKIKSMCFAHPTYAEGIFDLLINQK